MTDKTQFAVLKQGVGAWNAWRTAHADVRVELSHANLCGVDLINANLAGADLHNADLRGSILRGATLIGANLQGANFFRTVLEEADLSGANLVGARYLSCPQLMAARNWQSAFRDTDLACGAPIPSSHGGV